MNRLTNLALVVIACILILACAGAIVVIKFNETRMDGQEAAAILDEESKNLQGKTGVMLAETVMIGEGDICSAFFREPFETVVFMFRDGKFITFSTGHEKTIAIPSVGWIVEQIKARGRRIEDCMFVVHNHFSPAGFSESDLMTWKYLCRKGFSGVFGIYYTASGRFRSVED